MGKHLSVEPENEGFAAMMKIIDRGLSFELAQYIVERVERAAAENRTDHRFAMGMRSAFLAVAQTLHHQERPNTCMKLTALSATPAEIPASSARQLMLFS